jgi:ATP-dependent RNA helicase SUPV3L1/SUV3
LAKLTGADRKTLARRHVRLGVESVFMPPLLKPRAQRLRGLLWRASSGGAGLILPPAGRVSYRTEEATVAEAFHRAMGFRVMAGRAVRADMLERFAARLRKALRDAGTGEAGCALPPDLAPMLGMSLEEVEVLAEALGFRTWRDEAGAVRYRAERGGRRERGRERSETAEARRRRLARGRATASDSPFAVLAEKARA